MPIDQIIEAAERAAAAERALSPSSCYLKKCQDLSPEEKRYIETQDASRLAKLRASKHAASRQRAAKSSAQPDAFLDTLENFKKQQLASKETFDTYNKSSTATSPSLASEQIAQM